MLLFVNFLSLVFLSSMIILLRKYVVIMFLLVSFLEFCVCCSLMCSLHLLIVCCLCLFSSEPVVDYLTQYSGIVAGDLDRSVSTHHLVTLKQAYVKLRSLVDRGKENKHEGEELWTFAVWHN